MFSFPPLTPFVKKLLIGLFAFFVTELIVQNWVGLPVFEILSLDASHPGLATVWQLGTYVLVPPPGPQSVVMVLIGLVFLWWILAPFEARFGPKRTAQLALVTVVGGSLPALAAGVAFPQGARLAGYGPLLIGSIAAVVWDARARTDQLLLFGVVPMRPVYLVYLVVGFSVLMFLASGNVVELVGDLGGVGAGIGFVHWLQMPPKARRGPNGGRGRKPNPFHVVPGGRDDDERPRYLN